MMRSYKDLEFIKSLKFLVCICIALFFTFFFLAILINFGNWFINLTILIVSAGMIVYFYQLLKII